MASEVASGAQATDALQHRTSEGSCLGVITNGGALYAEDPDGDARWPRFGPQATAAGVRTVLGLTLPGNGSHGALNLCARYPQAFGVIDRAKGLLLSALAGLALSSAAAHDDEERRVDSLQAALASREVIGQAQGILIERERITPAQAFDILRRASQHLNIKLRTWPRPSSKPGSNRRPAHHRRRSVIIDVGLFARPFSSFRRFAAG